jgi:hypothetical protein
VKWAVVVVVLVDQVVVPEYHLRTTPAHTHRVLAAATVVAAPELFNHTVLKEAVRVMAVLCVSYGLAAPLTLVELGHQHLLPMYNT